MVTPKLRRVVNAIRRRIPGNPRHFDRVSLLGHTILVPEGVIRTPADYDDAWFLACARHSTVVFDVGSNLGQAALIALLCANVKEVVLIEANQDALVAASELLIRNHLCDRARFVCAFASNVANATTRLWTVSTGSAGSMYPGHAKTAARAGSSIEVPTVTLDDLVAELRIAPDLVKIDVEGAESLVLDGARACARGATFLVEMHSNPDLSMAVNASKVLDWCAGVGYAAWYLARGSRLESTDQIVGRGRCHLLLQPSHRSYPEWLVGIPQGSPLEI